MYIFSFYGRNVRNKVFSISINLNLNFTKYKKLEALRERRPPWPRQIITLILPTVKMLSLGGERLPTPLKKKKKKKKKRFWIITFTTIWVCYHYYGVFFAHLLILQYPDHYQNLISSSLYYSGPVHKISSQSVHNFLSNVVHRQTDRQTDRQTNQRYQKHNLLCQGGKYNYPAFIVEQICVRRCMTNYSMILSTWVFSFVLDWYLVCPLHDCLLGLQQFFVPVLLYNVCTAAVFFILNRTQVQVKCCVTI